jgi:hypothetical protein
MAFVPVSFYELLFHFRYFSVNRGIEEIVLLDVLIKTLIAYAMAFRDILIFFIVKGPIPID